MTTFIVRIAHDPAGRFRAVIERVSSGSKQQVDSCDAIGPAIAAMLAWPLTTSSAAIRKPEQES